MFIINPYRFASSTPPFVGPFNSYVAEGGAYSLRRMYTSYTGPGISVSRTIGPNTVEADVAFDTSTNYISLNSIITITSGTSVSTTLGQFCGQGTNPDGIALQTISVKTWYDQSGNNRHMSQGTPTNRPTIITTGTLNTDGGKVAILFNSTLSQYLAFIGGSFAPTSSTLFALGKPLTNVNLRFFGLSSSASGTAYITLQQTSGASQGIIARTSLSPADALVVSSSGNFNNQFLYYGRWRADNRVDFGLNGAAVATSGTSLLNSPTNWNSIQTGVLSTGSLSGYWNGYQKEMLAFLTNQSANRTAIENIINTY